MIDTTQLDIDAQFVINEMPKNATVTIQQPVNTTTDSGETTQAWTTFQTISANVETRRVTELYELERLRTNRVYSVLIPYIQEMSEKMRIVYGDINLNIISINDDELTRRYMIVEAIADKDTYDAFPTTTTTTTT